jgi:hypothetical protein
MAEGSTTPSRQCYRYFENSPRLNQDGGFVCKHYSCAPGYKMAEGSTTPGGQCYLYFENSSMQNQDGGCLFVNITPVPLGFSRWRRSMTYVVNIACYVNNQPFWI